MVARVILTKEIQRRKENDSVPLKNKINAQTNVYLHKVFIDRHF